MFANILENSKFRIEFFSSFLNKISSILTNFRYDGNNVAAGPSSSFAHSKISLADFRGNPMVVGSGDPDNKTVEIMYGGWSPQPDFPYVDKR